MKKSLAVMLALIMVLCMIPTTALAANGTGHQISVKIYKVVLDSSKPLGYQNPEFVKTITVICQDGTGHSGYNHSVNLKEFHPTKVGLSTTDWTGWQFNGSYNKGNDQKPFYDWTRDRVNATANVTGSEPYPCSKNFYLVYKEAAPQTQDITLTYNANGGSGAPGPETKKVEIGKSATFTVSATEPTRENYTFKGWSTVENAATAEYIGGNSITISQNTTLYAVWEENNPTPPTPPTTDKPEPPKPENTPGIPGLTGENVVKVMCVTENSSHAEKSYQLIADSYDVGNVEGDATSGYTCTITVDPAKYVTEYNKTHGDHALDPNPQSRSITFEWKNNSWALAAGQNLPITFTVIHNTQEPPTDTPKPPAADVIPKIVGKDAVKVLCTTNAKHAAMRCDLLENSFDIGVVTKEETSGEYFCNITVHADKYVKKYNEYLKGHTLETEGQTGTITLNWDAAGRQWKYTENKLPITFTVMCETVPEETYYIVTYTDGVGGAAFANQVQRVKRGDPTPAFNGTPSRSGYTFTGWTPAVTDTVTDNVTYTAQWKNNDNHTPGGGNGGGHSHYYPTTTPVPVIVIPPKTGDMTIWQSILHFLGIR